MIVLRAQRDSDTDWIRRRLAARDALPGSFALRAPQRDLRSSSQRALAPRATAGLPPAHVDATVSFAVVGPPSTFSQRAAR
jgi:hypothetical protein